MKRFLLEVWYTSHMGDFNTFKNAGDSINLSEIGDKVFTITAVEDSPYTNGDDSTPGVKISTEESWTKADGTKVSKIHTTRRAIVSKLTNKEFVEALAEGETFKVKCPKELTKPKGAGKPYFDLIAAV